MGEITIKESKQKPKKKRLPGWARFLIVMGVIFVVIPLVNVAIIYALFFDPTHKEINNRDDVEVAEVFNRVVVESLDNTTTSKKMSLAVNEDHLNQVIYTAFNSYPNIKTYLPNAYVEANDGHYNFFLEVNGANFFRTRVIMYTHSEFTEEKILFKVDNIQIGRVGGFNNLSGLISYFVSDNSINQALSSSGLHLTFSLANLQIEYLMSDFQQDVKNLIPLPDDYGALFDELISQQAFRTISAEGHNLFALDVNLNNLKITSATHGVNNFTIGNGYYNSFINNLNQDMVSLLNNNKIQEKDVNAVCKYFLGGEGILTSSEASIINTYKSSGAFSGYTAATNPYYDFDANVADELKTKIQNQITTQDIINIMAGTPKTIYLTSSDLNKMFSTSSAFSNIYNFVADYAEPGEAKNYKDNYIMLDNVSTIMNNNKLYFPISANFNGESAQISLQCEKQNATEFATVKFDVQKILLGDTEVGSNSRTAFMSLIQNALGNNAFSNVFSINGSVISFNLSTILAEKGITQANANVTFALENSTSTQDGKFAITLSKK